MADYPDAILGVIFQRLYHFVQGRVRSALNYRAVGLEADRLLEFPDGRINLQRATRAIYAGTTRRIGALISSIWNTITVGVNYQRAAVGVYLRTGRSVGALIVLICYAVTVSIWAAAQGGQASLVRAFVVFVSYTVVVTVGAALQSHGTSFSGALILVIWNAVLIAVKRAAVLVYLYARGCIGALVFAVWNTVLVGVLGFTKGNG